MRYHSPMRIGFFTDTYTPQINGVVTSIKLFTDALERMGHEVYIFAPTPRQPTDGPRIVRIPSIPFVFQPEMRVASIYSQQAYSLVRKADLDIIHSHDPFAIGLFGLAVAKRFRLPYVHTYHTLYPEYVHYIWETQFTRAMAERLSREFCDQCDLVLAPSTKIERALSHWGVTAPLKLLPTGVDTERYCAPAPGAAEALRARFGIRPEERLLTFVGRIGLEKNIDALVDAIGYVRTPGTRLMIVGNGPYRPALEKRIEDLGISDRVTFTGYLQREDVVAAYAASDLLFFASLSETQGLVIAEAMASGLPVVAVQDLAIGDAVTDGVNGFLVPEDPRALAEAADSVLSDPALRAAMGEASRRRADEFAIDRIAAQLAGFYEELARKKPAARRRPLVVRRVQHQIKRLRRRGRAVMRRYM